VWNNTGKKEDSLSHYCALCWGQGNKYHGRYETTLLIILHSLLLYNASAYSDLNYPAQSASYHVFNAANNRMNKMVDGWKGIRGRKLYWDVWHLEETLKGSLDGTSFPAPICTIGFPHIYYTPVCLLGLSSGRFSTTFYTNSLCAFPCFPT
jgi:hypothetical protein